MAFNIFVIAIGLLAAGAMSLDVWRHNKHKHLSHHPARK